MIGQENNKRLRVWTFINLSPSAVLNNHLKIQMNIFEY